MQLNQGSALLGPCSGDTITVKSSSTKTITSSSRSREVMSFYDHDATIVLKAGNVSGSGRGFRATYKFTGALGSMTPE